MKNKIIKDSEYLNYYYSDNFDYDQTVSRKYALLNPLPLSNISNTSNLVGKYVSLSINSTYGDSILFVTKSLSNSFSGFILREGNLDHKYYTGDSYIDNGD